jgi:hypothetical protein
MSGMSCDFFISRAGEDKRIALRVSATLERLGYSTFIQDKDFGHTAFTERMDQGFAMVETGARLIAILSKSYQAKQYCEVEARYPLIDDPSNTKQRLIVLRVEDCRPTGFLKPIPYVDLLPHLLDEEAFDKAVHSAVTLGAIANTPPRWRQSASVSSTGGAAEIERLLEYLQNEDDQEAEKNLKYGFLSLSMGAVALLIFEQLLDVWNWLFATKYYAIFDAALVFFLFALTLFTILAIGAWHIHRIVRVIENGELRRDQVAEFRSRVKAREWKSISIVDGAVSIAARNILSNKYRP